MKTVGIITIHRIYNYGSVLQAYALQIACERMGFRVEVIDYHFPNVFHFSKMKQEPHAKSIKAILLKFFYAFALYRQHKEIRVFVNRYLHLSNKAYDSPNELQKSPPEYDIYMTGSDQVWNPRYCYGDPAFLLHFVPIRKRKIAYAASIGNNVIDDALIGEYKKLLAQYDAISVREYSSSSLLWDLINRKVPIVLDPTLLLCSSQWHEMMKPSRIKGKYILCYYLNYSFDPFPYADQLADYLREQTGYKIVRIVRPPEKLLNKGVDFRIGLSVGEFLGLIAGAELVLTTSFHGTAFALNFSVPLFSIVAHRDSADSRQASLLKSVGLASRILALGDAYPKKEQIACDYVEAQSKLELLRKNSLTFLRKSLIAE